MLEGALRERADATLKAFSQDEQELCRRIYRGGSRYRVKLPSNLAGEIGECTTGLSPAALTGRRGCGT